MYVLYKLDTEEKVNKNSKLKILFINLPYFGHVVPTLGLVEELVKRGIQVTYLLPYDWQKVVSIDGVQFVGYENHKKLSVQIVNAYLAAEKIVASYDLVVYEQFFFLGKHLAENYGKPVVRIFTAPATNDQLMKEYIEAGGALGIFRHKWIGRLFTKEILKNISKENTTEISMKTDCWLDEIVQNSPDLNLVYTLEEYQPYREAFSDKSFQFLGASIYKRKEETFTIPTGEKPVIYISLGTVVKGAKTFFCHCMKAFADEDVTVIMAVGKTFPIKKLKNVPSNFYVCSFVPQLAVLEKADVFVTHGGMNSVSEALVCGVPMVVIPFMADQPTNARRIQELGLGKKLEYKKVNASVLRNEALAVLQDDEMKRKVSYMQQKMEICPGNVAGAEQILEYYKNESLLHE